MFRTKYERKKLTKHVSPTGEPYFEKTGWIYKDGEYVHVVKDVVPVYEMIQAQKDSVDLHAILERYENEGESALQKVQSMYVDTVDLPKNYAQLYDAVSKADDVFNAMPATIKDKFNNSAATFWKNYGREEFDDILNTYRSETLAKYGMIDNEPVRTAIDFKPEINTKESEVTDEQKSE